MRRWINDMAKTGKALITAYFALQHGDDWLTALQGLMPSPEGEPYQFLNRNGASNEIGADGGISPTAGPLCFIL